MKKKVLITSLIFSLAIVSLLSLKLPNPSSPPPVQAQSSNYDWPTLAHDNKRSGSTAVGPEGPYTKVWYRDFVSELREKVTVGYQPAIVRDQVHNKDLVYLGTENGSFYALELNSGSIFWRYPQTGQFIGGVLNSPTVEAGIIYFGSLDGNIYALDGTSVSNGIPTVKWIFRTGRQGGFLATPVVTNDSVYIGGRDGYFYALDKSNGSKRWEVNIGAPILTSPAFDPSASSGPTIYFGAENMKAYAYDTSGQRVWESNQMAGKTLRGGYPVVTSDQVIFRTAPNDHPYKSLGEGETLLAWHNGCLDYPVAPFGALDRSRISCFNFKATASSSADYEKEDQVIRNYLSGTTFTASNGRTIPGRPQYESFYVLNKSNGQKPYIAPVLWTAGSGNPGVPPIVGPDGKLWVLYRSYYSDYDNGSFFIMNAFGQMNPETGSINLRNPNPNPTDYSCNSESCNPWFTTNMWMIADETTSYSVAGNKIYTTQWSGLSSVDLTTGNLENIFGQRDNFAKALTDNNPWSLPFGARPDAEANHASYGPSIFGDKIVISYGSIIAMLQGHLPGTTPTPIATATPHPRQAFTPTTAGPVNIPTQTELEKYIWETPVSINIGNKSSDLKKSLESEVSNFLATGKLAPWMFLPGKGVVLDYFQEPAETAYILAQAYPYLSSSLKDQVKTFVQADWANKNPLASIYDYNARYVWDEGLTYNNGEIVQDSNKGRQPFAPGPWWYCQLKGCEGTNAYMNWIPAREPFDRLHNLWFYAQTTGDWSFLESNWNSIKSTLDYIGTKGRVLADISSNGEEAGLLGLPSVDPNCSISNPTYRCVSAADSVNRRVSALIAYTRIAQHMNDTAEVAWGADFTTKAMQARLRYVENFRPSDGDGNTCITSWDTCGQASNGGLFIQRFGFHSVNIPQYREMTPEVGRLLVDYARDDMSRFESFFDTTKPVAYYSQTGTYFSGEVMYSFPHNLQGIFLAKALAKPSTDKLSGDQLRKYLDIPWVKQDLFYWERLARNIEAYGTTCYEDLKTESIECPLTGSLEGDINGDNQVDNQDIEILFNNWGDITSSTPNSRADINGDRKVNGIDFTLVLKDWGE